MDDGLELNFAVPASDAVRRLAPKKGGRWTDRVKAKQAARRAVKAFESGKPAPAPKSQPAPAPKVAAPDTYVAKPARPAQPVVRPSKPAPHAPRPAARPSSGAAATRPAPTQHNAEPLSSPEAGPSRLPMDTEAKAAPVTGGAPKSSQIISSLFTGNPHLPRVNAAPEAPVGAPSNAPLLGDLNTLKGVGLDPLLVNHLQKKMGVQGPTGIQKACLPYMLSSPLDITARPGGGDGDEEGGEAAEMVHDGPRDVFIQSQTGSGKTLAYLLPIIQTLLPLSKLSYIDRSIGTLAIILAPTRELAQQIAKVLENLLSMALSLPDEEEDRGYTRWLVPGLLVGGGTRTHDKARLRKGLPILVATPGRLLDHLQNTSSFQCAKTMFLVLDEADRLMDLGFEETIQGILKALDGRRRNEMNAEKEQDEEGGGLMRWPYWSRGRQTVLCSATVDAKVERLAGMALRDPVVFRPADTDKKDLVKPKDPAVAKALEDAAKIAIPDADEKFTPPSQLAQRYVVAPTKLRLVTLVALLRSLVGKAKIEASEDGTKIIVFLSSTDSVDYHFRLLAGVTMGGPAPAAKAEEEEGSGKESADEDGDADGTPKAKSSKKKAKSAADADDITLHSALFPNTTIHRLHGSLPLRTRLASLKAFAERSSHSSILLATSVASRGLDLPLVRAVVQYDLPTEGGASEYVHRVGRTARAGKGGEAWAFVAPAEAEWVPWVEGKMGAATGSTSAGEDGGSVRLQQVSVEDVLRRGFGGRGHEYEARATDVQLALERWVLSDDKNAALARKAFSSFVRAYSTHPLEERRFFHVKNVHLGHLAKTFALREAPGAMAATGRPKSKKGDKSKLPGPGSKRKRAEDGADSSDDEAPSKRGKEATARNETERRMYEAVRKQGRLVKSGGVLAASGADFQVADTAALARMVGRK